LLSRPFAASTGILATTIQYEARGKRPMCLRGLIVGIGAIAARTMTDARPRLHQQRRQVSE
jgi:hypothetical protein